MEWQNYLVNQGFTNDDISDLKIGALLAIVMLVTFIIALISPPPTDWMD